MGAAESMETTTDPFDELANLVLTIAKTMVDLPDEIVIKTARGDGFVHMEVYCHDKDVGALIGQRGKYADAIRMLVEVAGSVRKIRVSLRIMPRDGDTMSRR